MMNQTDAQTLTLTVDLIFEALESYSRNAGQPINHVLPVTLNRFLEARENRDLKTLTAILHELDQGVVQE